MSLIYVKVNEGEFTKEEHEVTSILVENDTALLDIYTKPYVIKIFDQYRKIEYYKITTV